MKLEQFQKQQYLNIETFRKSGQGVKTPVWFAQDGDSLYVWTQADSGKAKRIRNNGDVNIAPCTASGDRYCAASTARARSTTGLRLAKAALSTVPHSCCGVNPAVVGIEVRLRRRSLA